MPARSNSSDRQTRLIFKDPREEKEYKRIQTRSRLLSYLTLPLMLAALDAIFTRSILLLVVVIPSGAVALILQYRYHGKLVEIQNSDQARWEE